MAEQFEPVVTECRIGDNEWRSYHGKTIEQAAREHFEFRSWNNFETVQCRRGDTVWRLRCSYGETPVFVSNLRGEA